MFFDRDKVQMTVSVEKSIYCPGETIRGVFRVRVLKDVTVTALRVRLYSKEKAEVKVNQSGASKEKGSDEFLHFDKLFNFFGYSVASGRKGGAKLAAPPGNDDDAEALEYPFEVQLPITTAPSFSYQFRNNGEVSLTYRLQGLCVIPNGFDGRVEQLIKVLAVTPRPQWESMRTTIHRTPAQTILLPPESCVCFRKDSNPTVTVEFACPQLLVYDETDVIKALSVNSSRNNTNSNFGNPQKPGGASPNCAPIADTPALPEGTTTAATVTEQRNPTHLPVTLKVINNSSKRTIQTVRVSLKQFVQIACQGVNKAEVRTVASVVVSPPSGGIPPRQPYQTEVRLPLGVALSMYGGKEERKGIATGGLVLPTMATAFVEVSNTLEVDLPGIKETETVTMADACWLVSAVDPTGRAPPAPVRYNISTVEPELVVGGAME